MVILDRLHTISFNASEHIRKNAHIYIFALSVLTLSAICCAAYHNHDTIQGESRTRSGQMITVAIHNSSQPIRQLHSYIHNSPALQVNIWDTN